MVVAPEPSPAPAEQDPVARAAELSAQLVAVGLAAAAEVEAARGRHLGSPEMLQAAQRGRRRRGRLCLSQW